jgi:lysophospholipase
MQLYAIPGNTPPAKTICQELLTTDGITLRTAVCVPAQAIGTVVLLQGRSEYLERYFETMRECVQRGYAVVAFDWRGQGGSQRLRSNRARGHVPSFRHFERDLDAVMELATLSGCPQPYYAVAHSTGGLVLLHYLLNHTSFSKAVMTAPLVDFRYGAWPVSVAKFLAGFAHFTGFGWAYLPGYKRIAQPAFEGNVLSSERRRFNRDAQTLQRHPELAIGGPTFSWFYGALRFIKRVRNPAVMRKLSCPVLFIAAEQEKVVDARAARQLADEVPGISYLEIEDAKHEILQETDAIRRQFWAAFESFVGDGSR